MKTENEQRMEIYVGEEVEHLGKCLQKGESHLPISDILMVLGEIIHIINSEVKEPNDETKATIEEARQIKVAIDEHIDKITDCY